MAERSETAIANRGAKEEQLRLAIIASMGH
jgi:hypothetical protein